LMMGQSCLYELPSHEAGYVDKLHIAMHLAVVSLILYSATAKLLSR
jgi:hypothetical protein